MRRPLCKLLMFAAMTSPLGGCERAAPTPPPIGPSSTTPPSPPALEESTGEPDPCPWNGTCAELEALDECGGWAVACGDGWRCIDTEAEAGIVCVGGESSSGSESGGTR